MRHAAYPHLNHTPASSFVYEGQTHSQDQDQMQLGSQPDAANGFQENDLSRSQIDLDAYISAHLEKFEESKRKWADCSLEDWKAGAEGESMVINIFFATKRYRRVNQVFCSNSGFCQDSP